MSLRSFKECLFDPIKAKIFKRIILAPIIVADTEYLGSS